MPTTSRTRGSSAGCHGSPRGGLNTPMSERQQMALVMQMTFQNNPPTSAPTPGEERKRTRQQRNERGETPLHVASIRGDHELVKKLLDQGQAPDVPDFAGWTALHEACSYGWYQVVEVLVEGGANVNAKGLDDDTPLHDAATSGNLLLVQYLIEKGADPTAKNTKGKTAEDYATQDIYNYLVSLKESSSRSNHVGRSRDDRKGGNDGNSRRSVSMDGLASDHHDAKTVVQDKANADGKDAGQSVASGSGGGDESAANKHHLDDDEAEDEGAKRRKRKDDDRAQQRSLSRLVSGSKAAGPASKTGTPVKGSQSGKGGGKGSSSKGTGKVGATTQGKSSSGGKGHSSSRDRQRSPGSSPKGSKDDDEDCKPPESTPKVPPLKIVIPGGAEQAGEGQRGGGKGRGGASTLPYVLPCSTADASLNSDSSDTNSDEKPKPEKGGRRVLRSHRSHERASSSRKRYKSKSVHDDSAHTSSSREHRHSSSVDLHPRKRKIKKEPRDSREMTKANEAIESIANAVQYSNPYQMYIHIRKQIDERQKTLFPVKPKPPKDFNKYLMNRCTYTLQSTMSAEPLVELPPLLPPAMKEEFISQEKERHRLRIQHLVEKEKLVLAVEQEILRVHGRAERAVANQSLPYSVCTMLRDREVYNVLAPEQEEKRNAQRSRCNGRQINSWLQEVDDKWERIKEGMLRRQHTEAETLHAVQLMSWEWRMKELGICDLKTTPKIDKLHVPQIHVSNFDLPA